MPESDNHYLKSASEFLHEMQRPSPYYMLGIRHNVPTKDIQVALKKVIQDHTSQRNLAELMTARKKLMDPLQRLEIDSQLLDREVWMFDLEEMRNLYALFNFQPQE